MKHCEDVKKLARTGIVKFHSSYNEDMGNFAWFAHVHSAEYGKRILDSGERDVEVISEFIHNGWSVSARYWIDNHEKFSCSSEMSEDEILEKKELRNILSKTRYSDLSEEQKEKDRILARAYLSFYV